jgi:hypothetical protein
MRQTRHGINVNGRRANQITACVCARISSVRSRVRVVKVVIKLSVLASACSPMHNPATKDFIRLDERRRRQRARGYRKSRWLRLGKFLTVKKLQQRRSNTEVERDYGR